MIVPDYDLFSDLTCFSFILRKYDEDADSFNDLRFVASFHLTCIDDFEVFLNFINGYFDIAYYDTLYSKNSVSYLVTVYV